MSFGHALCTNCALEIYRVTVRRTELQCALTVALQERIVTGAGRR